jgi:cytochrome c peroxidase
MIRALPLVFVVACARDVADESGAPTAPSTPPTGWVDGPWVWDVPDWAPLPIIPESNPMTIAKVALGRHLFYDERLSGNGEQACASCHEQAHAFSVPEATSEGSTGDPGVRNAQSLVNVAYYPSLTWANPGLTTLEDQILVPLFGEFPVEIGLTGHEGEVMAELLADPVYQELFEVAFPGEEPDVHEVVLALACFVRSLTSFDSPYDRFLAGDPSALSESALRGMTLFNSERLECFHCHNGYNFTESFVHEDTTFASVPFQNTGLYNLNGVGDYPADNTGLYEHTRYEGDMGRFRPPSLRNVAVSAPYAHDGSVADLTEMIDIYARGGRLIESGPYAGDGAENPHKDGFIVGFDLTESERADLVAFLESLTDEGFLTDPALADPWVGR